MTDVTELIEKVDSLTKDNTRLLDENKVLQSIKADFEKTISEKDTEISKLQKILANNFVATTEKPTTENIRSIGDIYADAIKNNMKQ